MRSLSGNVIFTGLPKTSGLSMTRTQTSKDVSDAPHGAGGVLTALVLTAMVCNLNISAATVALPSIATAFDASQTMLNLISLGAGLGLSMSVLYFGALADRYGRKQILLIGLSLLVVASMLSAFSVSGEMLIAARMFTGLAAGMAYPTTLSLITALWAPGARRTGAIAIWSSVGGMTSVAGGVLAGTLLIWFDWGSVFFLSVPVAAAALLLVIRVVPSHVDESTEPVDHLGGVLSVFGVGPLVLGISFVLDPELHTIGLWLLAAAILLLSFFVIRQVRASNPIFDLRIARRRMFWVPALCGMIIFGGMIGSIFVGEQFMQSVLGYSALEAGLAVIPAAVGLVISAPIAARLVTAQGTRVAIFTGYLIVLLGFISMLFWREHSPYILLGFSFLAIGSGAAFVITSSSRALTSSTPVRRVGMASATSDLQSDLGGSVFQALLGSILALGFARAISDQITASGAADSISSEVSRALRSSFASASQVAAKYPEYQDQILEAARQSLVDGALGAYLVGGVAIVIGAALVLFLLPTNRKERELLAGYSER